MKKRDIGESPEDEGIDSKRAETRCRFEALWSSMPAQEDVAAAEAEINAETKAVRYGPTRRG